MQFSIGRFIFSFTLLLVFAVENPSIAQSNKNKKVVASADTLNPIESLVSFASKHLHIPYRSGGSSKKGFDCSGFVRYCFDKWDIPLPHSSAAQAKKGQLIERTDAKPGDLIFFKGNSTISANVGHVGIITEVTPSTVKFIHSAWNGGIRYDLLDADYYRKRFIAIRRLID
jgi:cell wall-associated NlpC family hydrolase